MRKRKRSAWTARREAGQGARKHSVLTMRFALHVFRKKLFSLLIKGIVYTLIAMLCFSIVNSSSASTVMSLNYEESAKGKTPNGSRFSVSDFLSQDYLNAVLTEAGLQHDITTAELSDMLRIISTNARVVTDESDYYISSSYNVSVELPWDKRRLISAEDLLDIICRVYQEKFNAEYRVTAKSLELDVDLSEMDYNEISDYFRMMNNRIRSYLTVRNNHDGAFITADGQTYGALRKEVSNIDLYSLAEYESYIWENGVTANAERRLADLQEMNRQLNWKYASSSQTSDAYRKILEEYNNQMVSSVLIPTYDSTGAFYMSRTKVGIDDLTLEANELLSTATAYSKSIATNVSKINAIRQGCTKEQRETATRMAENIAAKMSKVVSEIERVDTEYYDQRISNYLVFTSQQRSLSERTNAKQSLMIAAALCLMSYAFSLWRACRRERKAYLMDAKR